MNVRPIIHYLIAGVWLVNGLYCKLLDGVPRHTQIVGRVLGEADASLYTKLIGLGECMIACWILSRYHRKLCAVVQASLVLLMNIIEQFQVVDLLLWGRWNFPLALLLIFVILYNGFTTSPVSKRT